MPKIKFKRGLEPNLPVLDEGEPGFTTDTEKFFIGSSVGNVQFAKQSDLNTTNANVATNTANIATNTATLNSIGTINANAELVAARGTYPTLAPRLDNVDSTVSLNTSQLGDITKNLESFRTSGMTDDQVISAAISGSVGYKIKFPFNRTYTLTQKIRIPVGNASLDLNGCTLNFSALTSGNAVEIVPGTHDRMLTVLENGTILGSNNVSNNTDGLFIGCPGDLTGDTAHYGVRNLIIDGFRDTLVFGNQTWCNSLYDVKPIHFWRYGVNFNTVTNAGENIRFFGGTFANGKAGACAVYTATNISPDVYFHSTSFDYTDSFFNINGGHFKLFGCHLENNNNNPMIKVTFTPGNSVMSFGIFGGTMGTGPGTDTSSPETALGRPWFVELNGDKISFTSDNLASYLYNKISELVHVTGGAPQIAVRSPMISPKAGNTPDICGATNLLWNGTFEDSTNFKGWVQTPGTGHTIAIDATTFYEGTKSASITATNGANQSTIAQDIVVKPGQQFIFNGYIKTALTAGNADIILSSFNQNGDNVGNWTLGSAALSNISGTTNWTKVGFGYVVPSGVTKFTLKILANAINGTIWADKFQAWVI